VANDIEMYRNELADSIESLQDRVVRELVNIASFDPKSLYDENGELLPLVEQPEHIRQAIADVKIRLRPSGEYNEDGRPIMRLSVKVKPKNKLKALYLLGKHLGMFGKR